MSLTVGKINHEFQIKNGIRKLCIANKQLNNSLINFRYVIVIFENERCIKKYKA